LCICAKIYSGILNKHLLSFIEQTNKFVNEQNGFRPIHSCLDHVFSLTTIIKNNLSKKKDIFVAFIDFRKTFDLINTELLLTKVIQEGVTGKIYFVIKSMLASNKSCVKINELFSDYFEIENGVRQGDSISSTLFALFINDLIHEKTRINLVLILMVIIWPLFYMPMI
jgi:hypothetical protein